MFLSRHFNLKSSPVFLPSPFFTSLSMILTTLIFTGCSSLGGGSIEKRAAKLSKGIETAYAIPASTAQRVSPFIILHSERQGIDPLLIAAIIRQKSTYRSQATSPAGAVGLMQIMPRYWQQSCPGNLYDENNNIQCGSTILGKYQQSAGDWKQALAYYNVGPSNYENNRKLRKQGKRYAKQVKQHQKALKNAL